MSSISAIAVAPPATMVTQPDREETTVPDCEHPTRKRETVTYGVYRCRDCGDRIHPTRRTSLTLPNGKIAAHGDVVRIAGWGRAVFFYVDEDRGGEYVHVLRLDARGGRMGTAAFETSRVRTVLGPWERR